MPISFPPMPARIFPANSGGFLQSTALQLHASKHCLISVLFSPTVLMSSPVCFLVFVLLGSVALCCGLGLITMYESSKWKDDSRLEICLGLCPCRFSLLTNFLIFYLCPVTYDISKESMKKYLIFKLADRIFWDFMFSVQNT